MSRAALIIFREVCLAKMNNQTAMDNWLETHLFAQAEPHVAAQFSREPGRVWLNRETALPLAVVTRSQGTVLCQVMAPVSDVPLLTQSFRDLISALATPRLEVIKERDQDVTYGDKQGRQIFFRVGPPPARNGGYVFALTATNPRPGSIALLMTASRAGPASAP